MSGWHGDGMSLKDIEDDLKCKYKNNTKGDAREIALALVRLVIFIWILKLIIFP